LTNSSGFAGNLNLPG